MDRTPLPPPIETTPHPERPALTEADLPIGGDALTRFLTALSGLAFAGLVLRFLAS